MKTLQLGSRPRFNVTFKDLVLGVIADPTTITCKVRAPDGTETPYTYAGGQVIKDSVGVYHLDLTLNQSGDWSVRWVAGGAIVATDEQTLTVVTSNFTSP